MVKSNPFAGLIRSRKVWIAIINAIAAILGLWVGYLASPDLAKLIMATWLAMQPVLLAVIMGITAEDNAKVAAASRDKATVAQLTAATQPCAPAAPEAELTDEQRALLTEAYEAGACAAHPTKPEV